AEVSRHPGHLTIGVTFSDAHVWDVPVALAWSQLTVSNQPLRGSIIGLGAGDFDRIAPARSQPGSRPVDPARRPGAYREVHTHDAAAAAALAEQATQDHFDLVVALDAWLRAHGWKEVYEIPGAIDLWARDPRGQRHIFEVKTLGDELSATRGAIAQLMEY